MEYFAITEKKSGKDKFTNWVNNSLATKSHFSQFAVTKIYACCYWVIELKKNTIFSIENAIDMHMACRVVDCRAMLLLI